MPTRERVEELIAAVMTNKHDEAIAAFYTEDASLQEPEAEPRRGRDRLVAGEKAMLATLTSVVTHRPEFVSVDGDRVAIHWVFDFVRADGKRRHVSEVAIQHWRGDRIERERFFYDRAASAWQ